MGFDRDALIDTLDHHDACNRDVTEADDPDMGWCYRMRERQADRILENVAAEPELDARCSEGMLITEHTREAATPPQYPHVDGPHLILGPECFTGDGEEVPQDVIMWRGEAYTRVPPQGIDRVDLNPLANRLTAHDFDADDAEVICQDVAEWLGLDDEGYPEAGSDRVLALVRPVEGIVLTSEERHVIADALENDLDFWPEDQRAWRRALAERLEKEAQ